MKLLFDFFPIIVFFIFFKLFGIYVATASFIVATVLQISIYWLKHRRFEKIHIITFVLGVVLGSATLFFHNELFIKWKPTAIYWTFALFFFFSHFIGKKTILQSMMENNITLPPVIWSRLNLCWVVFFILMGCLNLYVMYNFDTNTWVNFKLFGLLGLTFLFAVIQGIYLSKHLKVEDHINDKPRTP